ncbi:MAG: EF-hand domain-containing protein [Rhodospirillaceae bacterium]
MNTKLLIAASVAAALAIPLSAGAAGEKSSSGDSGAEKMFKSLDKNKDGYLSKDEVKGTPHDKDFATLDKNRDGKLSREEHAAAPEHAGDKSSSTGGTMGGSMSGSGTGGTGGSAAPKSGAPSKGY